jgi:hypothetical protein
MAHHRRPGGAAGSPWCVVAGGGWAGSWCWLARLTSGGAVLCWLWPWWLAWGPVDVRGTRRPGSLATRPPEARAPPPGPRGVFIYTPLCYLLTKSKGLGVALKNFGGVVGHGVVSCFWFPPFSWCREYGVTPHPVASPLFPCPSGSKISRGRFCGAVILCLPLLKNRRAFLAHTGFVNCRVDFVMVLV